MKIYPPSLLHQPASYIIYKEGGVVYALNSRTGQIDFSGTDASTVIQSAVNAIPDGGKVFVKAGRYALTKKITIPYDRIVIEGEGYSTIFEDNIPDDHCFAVRKPDGAVIREVFLRNFRIDCKVDKTTGDEINLFNLFIGRVINVFVEANAKAINGLYMTNCNQVLIYGLSVYNVKNNAIVCAGDSNDIYINELIIDNPGNPRQQTGVEILKSNGSLYICDSDIINCKYGIDFACDGDILWTWVDNTAVDNCVKGIRFPSPKTPGRYVAGCYIVNSWASSCEEYNVSIESGAILSDVKFINLRSYNAGCSGIYIGNATVSGLIEFINCTIASNSRQSANTHHGVFLDANASKVRFKSCIIRNDPKLGTGTQGYGIFANGNNTDIYIEDCDLRDNGIGAINSLGNITGRVSNNLGFVTRNRGTAIMLAGSTSVTVAHGLNGTPTKVLVTPRGNLGAVWVSSRDSTNITISCSTTPTVDTEIDWEAEL